MFIILYIHQINSFVLLLGRPSERGALRAKRGTLLRQVLGSPAYLLLLDVYRTETWPIRNGQPRKGKPEYGGSHIMPEIIQDHNPRGGRPMKMGRLVFDASGVPVTELAEISCIKYHLGYCKCGARIVICPEQADRLIRIFQRKGIGTPLKRFPKLPRFKIIRTYPCG